MVLLFCLKNIGPFESHLIAIATKAKDNREVILVFVHKSVDGDCIGSSCGLCEAIRNLGYNATVILGEPVLPSMAFLGIDNHVKVVTDKEQYLCDKCIVAVRDAAGALIENVTKSVRRKATVDDEYLEKPGSHKAHELLHTTYNDRGHNLK